MDIQYRTYVQNVSHGSWADGPVMFDDARCRADAQEASHGIGRTGQLCPMMFNLGLMLSVGHGGFPRPWHDA